MQFLGYEVVRKNGKKGRMQLSVPRLSIIEVTVHPSVTEEEIFEFLSHHKRFISSRMQRRMGEERFAPVKNYEVALVGGTEKPLKKGIKNGVEDGVLTVKNYADLPYLIEERYKTSFLKRVDFYAKKMNVTYFQVSFGKGKSRWGSCSVDGKLFFSRALLMVPLPIMDYVIVHELAHRREMNHSKRFWTEVGKVFPDWKERRGELKTYEFLTEIYE